MFRIQYSFFSIHLRSNIRKAMSTGPRKRKKRSKQEIENNFFKRIGKNSVQAFLHNAKVDATQYSTEELIDITKEKLQRNKWISNEAREVRQRALKLFRKRFTEKSKECEYLEVIERIAYNRWFLTDTNRYKYAIRNFLTAFQEDPSQFMDKDPVLCITSVFWDKEFEKKRQETVSKAMEHQKFMETRQFGQGSTVKCRNCGCDQVSRMNFQIRSADEPETSFFSCPKCFKTWTS